MNASGQLYELPLSAFLAILTGKRPGRLLVLLDALAEGEPRSFPYIGKALCR